MAGRKFRPPAATTEETEEALRASLHGPMLVKSSHFRLVSAGEIVGCIAHMRGCPNTFPTVEQAREFVGVNSVKAQLQGLVENGKAWAIKGDHPAVKGMYGSRLAATYYLDRVARRSAVERQTKAYAEHVHHSALSFAAKALAERYPEEYQTLLDDYTRLYPMPNFEGQL